MSFDAESFLAGLKPFQRDTVEYVFDRFFDDHDPVNRFLVADEVGLGKTMIARGLIAKLIELHLREEGRRIDIVYICSNQAIAKQNFSKLAIVGHERPAVTDRITTLPLHIGGLEKKLPEYDRGINVIPITPTTSLDLRSNVGRADERALLWWLLTDDRLLGRRAMERIGGQRLLMPPIQELSSFRRRIDAINPTRIDANLWTLFVAALSGTDLIGETGELIDELRSERKLWDEPWRTRRIELVASMRRLLAETCVAALEPDLVILDEFQRFPRLLEEGSPTGELARRLFDFEGCKSLLLSATPYRMFSRAHEIDDDHHRDFLATTAFLIGDAKRSAALEQSMSDYRAALRAAATDGGSSAGVVAARDAVRGELMRVMCRTERLGAAGDRNGMLAAFPVDPLQPRLAADDLRGYADLERVATAVEARDVVEFWKSAPYALNLMDDYALTRGFEQRARSRAPLPVTTRIDPAAARSYGEIDPANARLRGLVDKLDCEAAWKCLWLPPSLPYYTPGPPFDKTDLRTKRLIFSKWKVVPKAIAALTSFQMDRRIYGALGGTEVSNTAESRKAVGQPLTWRVEGKPTEHLLVAPARELAALTDPLVLAAGLEDGSTGPVDRTELLDIATRRVRTELKRLQLPSRSGAADPLWYPVAALRLDELARPGSVSEWLREDAFGPPAAHRGWVAHVGRLRRALTSDDELGAVPKDLAAVLAHAGVGAPGCCALRALRRSFGATADGELARAALRVANSLRLTMNLPASVAVVRATKRHRSRLRARDRSHWRAALDYCVDGNLQAVLDEYVHALRDWVGGSDDERRLAAVTVTASEAIGLGAASLQGRAIAADGTIDDDHGLAFHSRFAVRLDQGRGEDEQAVQRVDSIRKAFNSPFWPFVVATTSIGQEGLDFHLYSHAVVHWNLPSNPVDLEQREGRVHRFKNHAVRRNLAAAHRADGITAAPDDPWAAMFAAAPEGDRGLSPYWVFPGEVRIERHVPAEPLSIDLHRRDELVALMGIYRLAFGQPRQDELVAALSGLGDVTDFVRDALIDLTPNAR